MPGLRRQGDGVTFYGRDKSDAIVAAIIAAIAPVEQEEARTVVVGLLLYTLGMADEAGVDFDGLVDEAKRLCAPQRVAVAKRRAEAKP